MFMPSMKAELWEGIVNDLNNEDKEVCVQTEVQEFWFRPEDLRPIPLNENELFKFNFEKETNGDGWTNIKRSVPDTGAAQGEI